MLRREDVGGSGRFVRAETRARGASRFIALKLALRGMLSGCGSVGRIVVVTLQNIWKGHGVWGHAALLAGDGGVAPCALGFPPRLWPASILGSGRRSPGWGGTGRSLGPGHLERPRRHAPFGAAARARSLPRTLGSAAARYAWQRSTFPAVAAAYEIGAAAVG